MSSTGGNRAPSRGARAARRPRVPAPLAGVRSRASDPPTPTTIRSPTPGMLRRRRQRQPRRRRPTPTRRPGTLRRAAHRERRPRRTRAAHRSRSRCPAARRRRGFPSTGVLDDFNRVNGRGGRLVGRARPPPGSRSSRTSSRRAAAATRRRCGTAPMFGADQEASVTLSTITASSPEHDLMLKVQGQAVGAGHLEVRYDATQSRVLVSTFTPGTGWQLRRHLGARSPSRPGTSSGARALANGTVANVCKNGAVSLHHVGVGVDVRGQRRPHRPHARRRHLVAARRFRRRRTVASASNTPPVASITAPTQRHLLLFEPVDRAGSAPPPTPRTPSPTWPSQSGRGFLHHNNHIHPDYFTATGARPRRSLAPTTTTVPACSGR